MDTSKIGIGARAPEEINVMIEVPQGSAIKYEFNAETGELGVDRIIGEADVFPYSYGFIPETLSPDGDPLDAMVVSSRAFAPETIVPCRPVAVLKMADEKGRDDKIICVPVDEADAAISGINDLDDMDLPLAEKIKLFFKRYKEMEQGKWTKVQNFGDKAEAVAVIRKFATIEKND